MNEEAGANGEQALLPCSYCGGAHRDDRPVPFDCDPVAHRLGFVLCHRDLDDDGLSCHLPHGHDGPCSADLIDHLAERAAYGRAEHNQFAAVYVDVSVLEAVVERFHRLAESEAAAWSYAHHDAARTWGGDPLGDAIAKLRHEMERGVDYAVVDISWLRVVLEALGEQFVTPPPNASSSPLQEGR